MTLTADEQLPMVVCLTNVQYAIALYHLPCRQYNDDQPEVTHAYNAGSAKFLSLPRYTISGFRPAATFVYDDRTVSDQAA
jgi:hypothetical protein